MDMEQPDMFTDLERLYVVKWMYYNIKVSEYAMTLIYDVRLSDGNLYKMEISIYPRGTYGYIIGTMFFNKTDIEYRTITNVSEIEAEFGDIMKYITFYVNKPSYKQDLYNILHSMNNNVNIPDDLYQDMTDRFVAAILKKNRDDI